jgi:arylsulfatase A-like enzyme
MKPKSHLLAAGLLLAGLASGLSQPVITRQPQSQTNVVGSTVTLAVEATGTQPLAYQWREGGIEIINATNTMLLFANLQLPNAGSYTVVVSNVEGSVTSTVAYVRVLVPPTITTSPTNQIAEVGDIVTLSVRVAGTAPLSYQWFFNDAALVGKTNTNLYLRNVQLTNAGAYTMVATNIAGSTTSQVATLKVVPAIFPKPSGTNILLVIADDYGADSNSLYNTNASASLPPTPNINSLYDSGVLFRNAYACPSCSPTRSCLITGRYGFRTGIGYAIDEPYYPALQANELTIPKILTAHPQLGYRHASIGKWHLGEQPIAPNVVGGWAHFSGSLPWGVDDYFRWPKTVDGVTTLNTSYATTDNVNDALTWIKAQGTNSWFLWLAFNAPHAPYHKPPNYLHSYETLPIDQNYIDQHPRPYFEAMTEAMDTEFGRLLGHLDRSNTVIIFIGDNGSEGEVIQPPFQSTRAKRTLYEGGIRVPMIVSGPVVVNPRRENTNLVHTVDVFTTILELAGVTLREALPTNLLSDSHSLLPILTNGPVTPREWLLSEQFSDYTILPPLPGLLSVQGRAIRDEVFKLIRFKSGAEEFYNLLVDPYETTNLLRNPLTAEQSNHYTALTATLATLQNVPQITGFSYSSNRFAVSVGYVQGVKFSLYRSPMINGSTWTKAPALSKSNNFVLTLTDPNPAGTQYFYRVSTPLR